MEYIAIIIALAMGIAVGWILKQSENKALKAQLLDEQKRSSDAATAATAAIEAERRTAAEAVANERATAERLRAESDRQWNLKFDAMKSDLLKMTSEQLTANNEALRTANVANIGMILNPLKEQMEAFSKAVNESRTQNEVNTKSIEQRFADTLRLFQTQQENVIGRLKDETSKIGNDAMNLARALKANTKRQGNWGEMVLLTMLENSGLEEGVHFFPQYNVVSDDGSRNIPDVVIKFPEGRSIIVDSKVSLKAYAEYFETEDEEKKEQLMRAHLSSVEKHIDELSEKNYPRVVENSMDYVLMFIPNESSYVAAIKMEPNLLRMAYDKKVIVISPNNLMMALQLAYNLWQTDKQVKNINKIIERGTLLYEKVSNFQSSFIAIGDQIAKLQAVFSQANSQLSTGPGNVIRQCEMLRQFGVTIEKKKRLRTEE